MSGEPALSGHHRRLAGELISWEADIVLWDSLDSLVIGSAAIPVLPLSRYLSKGDSGVAEPGARDTEMEGSIAAPIIGSDDTLEGVIGIAKPEPYEFTPAERDRLLRVGTRIAQRL